MGSSLLGALRRRLQGRRPPRAAASDLAARLAALEGRDGAQDGAGAAREAAALMRGPLAPGDAGAVRDFCRRLFANGRHSYLVALEETLRAEGAASGVAGGTDAQAGAIAAFYALRAEDARQRHLSVSRLHDAAVAGHRARGAYEDWQERLLNELLANALMKQGRMQAARAVVAAGLAAAPDHAGLRLLGARLEEDRAAALAGLERAALEARAAGARFEGARAAATLLAADLAAALGEGERGAQALRAVLDEDNPSPDVYLALANLARRAGRHGEQRRFIDRWFSAYGLWSPAGGGPPDGSRGGAQEGERPFRLRDIPASGLARRAGGPKVTVIMTAYNAQDTVDYAAASVLDQTHGDLELFIVDDASADGTRARLVAIAEADRRVRLFFNETNVGPYVSKNRALAEMTGAFATFHDADDWRHPQHLERHLARMAAEPGLAAARSRWSRIDGEGAFALAPWGAFAHANPAATMIRRAVFEAVGVFDSVRVGADTELWARIQARYGAKGAVDMAEPLALGLARADSLTSAGAAAIDAAGASAPRLAYWEAQGAWRDAVWRAGGRLFMPFPQDARPFPAPDGIVSGGREDEDENGSENGARVAD